MRDEFLCKGKGLWGNLVISTTRHPDCLDFSCFDSTATIFKGLPGVEGRHGVGPWCEKQISSPDPDEQINIFHMSVESVEWVCHFCSQTSSAVTMTTWQLRWQAGRSCAGSVSFLLTGRMKYFLWSGSSSKAASSFVMALPAGFSSCTTAILCLREIGCLTVKCTTRCQQLEQGMQTLQHSCCVHSPWQAEGQSPLGRAMARTAHASEFFSSLFPA